MGALSFMSDSCAPRYQCLELAPVLRNLPSVSKEFPMEIVTALVIALGVGLGLSFIAAPDTTVGTMTRHASTMSSSDTIASVTPPVDLDSWPR